MRRGEIYWADLGTPAGRRPVLIVSRTAAVPVLSAIVVAPITRTMRGIASEVPLGTGEGLPEDCVASCDSLLTVPKTLLEARPTGELSIEKVMLLDQALRVALEVSF